MMLSRTSGMTQLDLEQIVMAPPHIREAYEVAASRQPEYPPALYYSPGRAVLLTAGRHRRGAVVEWHQSQVDHTWVCVEVTAWNPMPHRFSDPMEVL